MSWVKIILLSSVDCIGRPPLVFLSSESTYNLCFGFFLIFRFIHDCSPIFTASHIRCTDDGLDSKNKIVTNYQTLIKEMIIHGVKLV